MESKISSALLALAMCALIAFLVIPKDTLKDQPPQIKPVECMNYYQWTYWSTKRDRVLNKRKRTHTDSVELRLAEKVLGIDTQDLYPDERK